MSFFRIWAASDLRGKHPHIDNKHHLHHRVRSRGLFVYGFTLLPPIMRPHVQSLQTHVMAAAAEHAGIRASAASSYCGSPGTATKMAAQ